MYISGSRWTVELDICLPPTPAVCVGHVVKVVIKSKRYQSLLGSPMHGVRAAFSTQEIVLPPVCR